MNQTEVETEMKTRIVSDKVVGNTLEQRVVDEHGKTVEFYQLTEGRSSILKVDDKVPLKYSKLLKAQKLLLKENVAQLKHITVLEAEITLLKASQAEEFING